MVVQSKARTHDYLFDPLFIVSGLKDHHKAAIHAKYTVAQFQICPIFKNMFSDSRPDRQMVMRRPTAIKHGATTAPDLPTRSVDINGADRYRFFTRVPRYQPTIQVPTLQLVDGQKKSQDAPIKHKKLQTKYRESETQTIPWQPEWRTKEDPRNLEILKLEFLKWGAGLPAGVHEVKLIERARMKRAWNEYLEMQGDDLEARRQVIEALEREEWVFREQEIQDIQDLRMELLERMIDEVMNEAKKRNEMKIRMFAKMKDEEKNAKLEKLRNKYSREIRKIDMKLSKLDRKTSEKDVVYQNGEHKSEIYAPLARHGDNPKYWHQIIDESMKKYRAHFKGVENFCTLPAKLDRAMKIKDCCCLKMKGTRLCMRETKWTQPILKQLHEELKALREPAAKTPLTLRKKKEVLPPSPPTPEVEGIPSEREDVFQAIIHLQAIIRGRAAQMLIYEGRDRCRHLINELKYSYGLLDEQKTKIYHEKLKMKMQQRTEYYREHNENKVKEALKRLRGNITGSLLDFLNKELRRLEEERKIHALCMLYERERRIREAFEAGRRQKEIQRRREHDEMFRQVAKVHADTIDIFLENIVTEGVELASGEEAHDYVSRLAKKIDDEAYDRLAEPLPTIDEDEELIADLVHHFVLPEVKKELAREQIRKRQKAKLKAVHDAIYTTVENLPNIEEPAHEEEIAIIEEVIEEESESIMDEGEEEEKLSNEKHAWKKLDASKRFICPLDYDDDDLPSYRTSITEFPEPSPSRLRAAYGESESKKAVRELLNEILQNVSEIIQKSQNL